MFWVNKLVGALLTPLFAGAILALSPAFVAWRFDCGKGTKARRWAIGLSLAATAWIWIWSTAAFQKVIGTRAEGRFPPRHASEFPAADAIVVLGGGLAAAPGVSPYPDMAAAADRAWHAARLYRAGKAPLVIPTGSHEDSSTVPLLLDLGVPREAILVESAARNTEEHPVLVRDLLRAREETAREEAREAEGEGNPAEAAPGRPDAPGGEGEAAGARRPTILVVTSSWHMRRALLMFARYAPELDVVPAPSDYETLVSLARPLSPRDFFPSFDAAAKNGALAKEWVGYWGYRLFRRGGRR